MDEMEKITSRLNEARNIVEQTRDIDAMRAAGAIDEEAYIDAKARRLACLRVAAKCEAGEYVGDDEFAQMIEDAREEAAQPSQEEQNAADIAYLLMIGGEE